jgi:hypothetical protein
MGYGRIMISVLFRSVDLKLPPNLLGWDLGSVEVLGENVTAEDSTGVLAGTKIVLNTDVGKGTISKNWVNKSEQSASWDLKYIKEGTNELHKHRVIVPVRRRYQAPLRLEFFSSNSRHPTAYAVYWLSDLVDNTVTELTLPVYKADKANSKSLTQNYLTDVNKERNDIEAAKIGTVKLTVRFKMGMDNTHYQWVKTNDEHETYESWQCSVAEGYRTRIVKRETPKPIQDLVNQGRLDGASSIVSSNPGDDMKDEDEHSPVRIPREAPGFEKEIDDPPTDPHDERSKEFGQELTQYASSITSIISDDASSLGVQEDLTDSEIEDEELKKRRQNQDKKAAKADLYRKQRGIMNIKAVRHLKFGKDEVKILGHKIKGRFSMKGREPGGKFLESIKILLNANTCVVETEL